MQGGGPSSSSLSRSESECVLFILFSRSGNSLKTPATHKKNALSSKNLFSEDEEPKPVSVNKL